MGLDLAKKQQVVTELAKLASAAQSVAAAEYRGLTADQLYTLRVKARLMGVCVQVCRNTLARRAIQDTPFACLAETLVGPIILFFATEEPSAAAKLLRDFVKTHEMLQVKALVLDEQLYGPDQLEVIASLPTRDEALSKLLYVLKAPVTQMVRTINEPVAQMVRVFAQIAEKKS